MQYPKPLNQKTTSTQAHKQKTSKQSDSSRSKTVELHIQQRVADELKKISEREDQSFADIEKKFSAPSSEASSSDDSNTASASLLSSITSIGTSKEESSPSRDSVLKEIETLKQRLSERKKPVQQDAEVEKVKGELVACLRLKDRRPLDCWEEVEAFKSVVGKAERKWVEKVIS